MEFINEFSQYPFAVYAARIILAGVCGFAIGLERSHSMLRIRFVYDSFHIWIQRRRRPDGRSGR